MWRRNPASRRTCLRSTTLRGSWQQRSACAKSNPSRPRNRTGTTALTLRRRGPTACEAHAPHRVSRGYGYGLCQCRDHRSAVITREAAARRTGPSTSTRPGTAVGRWSRYWDAPASPTQDAAGDRGTLTRRCHSNRGGTGGEAARAVKARWAGSDETSWRGSAHGSRRSGSPGTPFPPRPIGPEEAA